MLIAGFPLDSPNFKYYLEEPGKPSRTRCIDNSLTCRSKCHGYCACAEHPGYLTKKQLIEHKCIEKECSYYYRLIKNNEKDKIHVKGLSLDKNEQKAASVLKKANEITKNYEGLKIVKISVNENGIWCLYYVSISNYNYQEISNILKIKLGIDIKMINMKLSFDEVVDVLLNEN